MFLIYRIYRSAIPSTCPVGYFQFWEIIRITYRKLSYLFYLIYNILPFFSQEHNPLQSSERLGRTVEQLKTNPRHTYTDTHRLPAASTLSLGWYKMCRVYYPSFRTYQLHMKRSNKPTPQATSSHSVTTGLFSQHPTSSLLWPSPVHFRLYALPTHHFFPVCFVKCHT